MAFDQPTRNRLARFVGDARRLVADEFTQQFQSLYGISNTGQITPVDQLAHLDEAHRATAERLRERIRYLVQSHPETTKPDAAAVSRLAREQAFTVLNRLAALRMAEKRGLIIESVGQGYQSRGFKVYETVAGSGLGDAYHRYRRYLFCLFDELAVDLGVLFDRRLPSGLLFPREKALLDLLALLNAPELDALWGEDETIGWIYQYYNDETERKKMREESSAPRNSRELAVRNQFFTPRYVVEFLTDNTLGRLWYEMTQGQTSLKEQCRYLVRRPHEFFLPDPPERASAWLRHLLTTADFSILPKAPPETEVFEFLNHFLPTLSLLPGLGLEHSKVVDRLYHPFFGPQPSAHETLLAASPLELVHAMARYAIGRDHDYPPASAASVSTLPIIGPLWDAFRSVCQTPPANLSQEELLKRPVFLPRRPLKNPREIRLLDPACGSMHFGLYAFDLFETIYAEAWNLGLISPDAYGGDTPPFQHASVRVDRSQKSVHSNDLHHPVLATTARIVLLKDVDSGDGMFHVGPFITDDKRTFRPGTRWDVPLAEFDYVNALGAGWFTPEEGERLVRETPAAWEHDRFDPLPVEEVLAAFHRDVPRLIIEHNLHGIDIDQRAVQIAGLSLWLRAQRAWHQAGVQPADRPRITRSNLVCAEPMPGEKELLREFVEQQFPAGERPAFAFLLEKIFDRMTLAGEAGSLLRIEEEIRTAIAEARALAQSQSAPRQARLFPGDERPEQAEFDLRGLNDEQFWQRAEQRIYDALEAYAEQAENGGGFQRRLFADDAAQGFAFIDLCRKRYDVVVMNPPFGKPAKRSLKYLQDAYPDDWKDIYAAFFTRTQGVLSSGGLLGAITSLLFLYSKQLRELRHLLIEKKRLRFVVELGGGVLDNATVETSLSVISSEATRATSFLDLTSSTDRESDLLAASELAGFQLRELKEFTSIYGWPLCYHVQPGKLALWKQKGRVEPELAEIVAGNHTFDDFRFLHLRWEVDPTVIAKCWIPYEKGGDFQPFFSTTILLFNWDNDGIEARAYQIGEYGTDAQTIQSISKWFKPGITYPRVSSIGFSPRVLPGGCIFSEKGMSIFPTQANDRLPILALLSSSWVEDLLCAFGRHRAYENSAVANLPFGTDTIEHARSELTQLATSAIVALHDIAATIETSPFFVRILEFGATKLLRAQAEKFVSSSSDRIDEIVADVLFPSNREAVSLVSEERSFLFRKHVFDVESEKEHSARILSFCLGSVFGRWDIRYAAGERPAPELPDPFAPLPVCPPGMLQGDDSLPLSPEAGRRLRTEGHYPLDVAWDGILVDDPEHPLDLERRVHAALAVLWDDRADALEHEACALLGVPTLREWFRRPAGFFADHLKRYSKSRRQAPIYWPLSTASGRYTVWLYYHRLTDQTLHRVIADFLNPKLKSLQQQIADSRESTALGRGAVTRLAELQESYDELTVLRAELERVVALPWRPNLNDGVLITASPLWRLFRLGKWQKDLKACWDSLVVGEFDWAHLAYSIWPDRVREKCRTDRSLAIAHGLEDLCTVDPPKPKAKRGKRMIQSRTALTEEE